jgi:ketosteroid isomerase-like protein
VFASSSREFLVRRDGDGKAENVGRMKSTIALFVALLSIATAASRAYAADATQTIPAFLAQSAYDWNHGRLDAFMTGYENSPNTEYISSKTVIHGYANIRARYAAHYHGGMGTLSFSDLAIQPLGSDYAVVVAHWHLAMTDGTHPTGIFSLVVHRSPTGWHIVADHTP